MDAEVDALLAQIPPVVQVREGLSCGHVPHAMIANDMDLVLCMPTTGVAGLAEALVNGEPVPNLHAELATHLPIAGPEADPAARGLELSKFFFPSNIEVDPGELIHAAVTVPMTDITAETPAAISAALAAWPAAQPAQNDASLLAITGGPCYAMLAPQEERVPELSRAVITVTLASGVAAPETALEMTIALRRLTHASMLRAQQGLNADQAVAEEDAQQYLFLRALEVAKVVTVINRSENKFVCVAQLYTPVERFADLELLVTPALFAHGRDEAVATVLVERDFVHPADRHVEVPLYEEPGNEQAIGIFILPDVRTNVDGTPVHYAIPEHPRQDRPASLAAIQTCALQQLSARLGHEVQPIRAAQQFPRRYENLRDPILFLPVKPSDGLAELCPPPIRGRGPLALAQWPQGCASLQVCVVDGHLANESPQADWRQQEYRRLPRATANEWVQKLERVEEVTQAKLGILQAVPHAPPHGVAVQPHVPAPQHMRRAHPGATIMHGRGRGGRGRDGARGRGRGGRGGRHGGRGGHGNVGGRGEGAGGPDGH